MKRIVLIAAALSLTALAQAQEFKPFGIGLEEPLAIADASVEDWFVVPVAPAPNTNFSVYRAYVAADGLVCEVEGTHIGSPHEVLKSFLELHQELRTIYGDLGIYPHYVAGPYRGKNEDQSFVDGDLIVGVSSSMPRDKAIAMSMGASSDGDQGYLRISYKSRQPCAPKHEAKLEPTGSSGL